MKQRWHNLIGHVDETDNLQPPRQQTVQDVLHDDLASPPSLVGQAWDDGDPSPEVVAAPLPQPAPRPKRPLLVRLTVNVLRAVIHTLEE